MKKTFTISTLSQAVLLAIAMPAMANGTDDVAVLDEITVSGGSMYRMGEVPVLQAKSAVAITRDELDKQAVNKVDEIARYQAGFANQVFGEDTNTNWFRVRGAEVSQAVDGLPTFSYGFFTPYVNSFGLEAVEITKGADAITFGAAQSGGLINYVSKRPHKEQVGQGELKLNIGNNAQRGVGADYTGQFADNARYRLVGYYGGKDGQWENTKNETLYIAPSFEFDLSERTRLTLLANYQRDHGVPSSNFLPAYGTLVPTPNGYISRSTNLGDPVNDTETNRQYSVGYELAHDFANGLSIQSSYRYRHQDNFHRGSYPFPSVGTDYSVARGVVFNDGKTISHNVDNNVKWDFTAENFKNTLVVGTDYRRNKVDTMYDGKGFGATSGSNIFNPSVGYAQAQNPNPNHNVIKAQQLGFYLQNQSRFADLVLGLGIRHDRAKQQEHTSTQSVKKNHTSYNGSLMYESPFGLNPYFAYSESFSLPVGISGDERLYDPNISRQYEVGVKYLPTWLDGVITVAGFRAKDTGAVIANTNAQGLAISTSSDDPIYRKGVEVQLDANLTQNWTATLAYTYTKSETKAINENTATTAQVALGEKFRNHYIPTSVFSAKTAYTFDGTGLTLGAGIRYVGHSVATKSVWNAYSHARVPSSTVVDLMARYQFQNGWALQVNADNVGNRRYIASCDSYCYYGAGHNVNASLNYKF